MEFLAGIMGINVLGYAIMSNDFQCVLRSRHDVVATWSEGDHDSRMGSHAVSGLLKAALNIIFLLTVGVTVWLGLTYKGKSERG
jgi:hypothetical protein